MVIIKVIGASKGLENQSKSLLVQTGRDVLTPPCPPVIKEVLAFTFLDVIAPEAHPLQELVPPLEMALRQLCHPSCISSYLGPSELPELPHTR